MLDFGARKMIETDESIEFKSYLGPKALGFGIMWYKSEDSAPYLVIDNQRDLDGEFFYLLIFF